MPEVSDPPTAQGGAGPFQTLLDIFRILAEALKSQPYLLVLVSVLIIAAIVTIAVAALVGVAAVYGFLVICLVLIIVLAYLAHEEINQKRRQIAGTGFGWNVDKATLQLFSRLNKSQREYVRRALAEAAREVAETVFAPSGVIRANVFALDTDGRMKMADGLTFNMNRPEELTVSMPVGYGSTGRCFQSAKPNLAIFQRGWGKDSIEDPELQKVHPDLQWIISVPILGRSSDRKAIGVLNVDGLHERRPQDQLQNALRALFLWSETISLLVQQRR